MATEVKYRISSEDNTREGLKSAEANLGNFTKSMDAAGKKLSDVGAGMLDAGKKLSLGVTAPLLALGVKMVRSADEQAKAVAQLERSIATTGRASQMSLGGLTAFAGEMQKITLYGDETTIAAMALIQSLADLGDEKGLQDATRAAMDFATAMDIDLQTAAVAVGKTLGSETNALGRYGVEIAMIGDATSRLGPLTEALAGKFGGAAEAAAQAGLGQWTIFMNRMSDIGEKFGNVILPRLNSFLDKLAGAIEWFEKLDSSTANLLVTLAGIAAALGPALIVGGGAASGIGGLLSGLAAIGPALGGIGTAATGAVAGMTSVLGVIAPLAVVVIGVAVAIVALAKATEDLKSGSHGATTAMRTMAEASLKSEQAVAALEVQVKQADIGKETRKQMEEMSGALRNGWGSWSQFQQEIKKTSDDLVGHSIIPDMVNAILWWMDKLVAGMDEKSKTAADKTTGNLRPLFGGGSFDIPGSTKRGTAGSGASGEFASAAGSAILQIVDAFVGMIKNTEAFTNLMERINLTLKPFLEQIVAPLVSILTPIVQILMRIASGLMPAFAVALSGLNDFIQATLPFWDVLGKVIVTVGTMLGWLAQKVFALGQFIYYALTFQFGKIGEINWGTGLGSMLDEAMAQYGAASGGLAALPASATGGGVSSGGGGANYTTPRIINIADGGALITVNTEVITGDGGIDELVIMLRDKLRRVEALGY